MRLLILFVITGVIVVKYGIPLSEYLWHHVIPVIKNILIVGMSITFVGYAIRESFIEMFNKKK